MAFNNKDCLFTINIPAPIDVVWNECTTANGIRNFLAPECCIVAQPDGPFEIYFDLSVDNGHKSSEGNYFLSVIPQELLSFSWTIPPIFTSLKNQKTFICLYFKEQGENTMISFFQEEHPCNPDWEQACKFSRNLWQNIFLPRLRSRFINGPIDWDTDMSMSYEHSYTSLM